MNEDAIKKLFIYIDLAVNLSHFEHRKGYEKEADECKNTLRNLKEDITNALLKL